MISEFTGKYAFLSNFHPCEMEYEGIKYPSTEHAYQAAKTIDPEIKEYIAELPTPGATKKFARKLAIREDWDQVKFDIMDEILTIKFLKEPFRTMLLETGDEELVEGNYWHDITWGRCHCKKHNGIGKNALGEALMKIRTNLK
jgi:ribA/ribD-fused uncharacterized protein